MPLSPLQDTKPILHLTDVGVDVPGRPGLIGDVQLSIAPGARIAVMGPSGSGKSTLLAVIGGLLEPTVGQVHRTKLQRSEILWISQNALTLPFRTIAENVALAALPFGHSWKEALRRADDACQTVGLGSVAATKTRSVSGGERQRVGVARALVGDFKLVLADEPTASLDEDLVLCVADALNHRVASHVSVVTATHDTRVAQQSQQVLLLNRGALHEQ